MQCRSAAITNAVVDAVYTVYDGQQLGSGKLYTYQPVTDINQWCPASVLQYKYGVQDDCCCQLYQCLIEASPRRSMGWVCAQPGHNAGCPSNAACSFYGTQPDGSLHQKFSQVQGRPLSGYTCLSPFSNQYCGATLPSGQVYKCVCCQDFVQACSCVWGS